LDIRLSLSTTKKRQGRHGVSIQGYCDPPQDRRAI
jgi:hypothetical protein